MLKEDITEERKKRHAITQEDFTPPEIVSFMLDKFDDKVWKNAKETLIDYSAGNGNFLVAALRRKLENTKNVKQAIIALSSIYGVEMMADNVEDCRWRLYDIMIEFYPEIENDYRINNKVRSIIKNRIQWYDSLKFNYENWPKITSYAKKNKIVHFNEVPGPEDTKFPMWFKDENRLKPNIIELSLFTDADFE